MTIKRSLTLLSTVALIAGWLTVVPHGQRRPTVSDDLAVHSSRPHRHRVIVQADDVSLAGVRGRRLGVLRRAVSGALALDVTDAELDALTRDPNVLHISGDLPVQADMAVTNKVTNAASVWAGTPGGLLGIGGTPGYSGSGITVAVLDSGIAAHQALGTRVIAHVNFVSTEPGLSADLFGHGTHVAGIVGGSGSAAAKISAPYTGGSAPSVKIVDVRVLGANGSGLTSDVIAGIDWVIANRRTYGVRIINLSLGHPVTEPAASDPLDQAVARAVSNGLVVVAAAGNYGRTADGAPVLGGITVPGNSPYAITVGATDTKGTVDASDDQLAPYSSRGPTKYDFAVKPDVVAPGTRIVSLEVPGSYLSVTYPTWHVAGTGQNAYLRMSGTSMAAPVVSGGIALLLNAQPSLTPAQVKVALQTGARYLADGGLIGSGTGAVDFAASLRITNQGLIGSLLTSLTNLLGLSSGASFRDKGTLIDRIYDRTGIRLLRLLDLGALLQGAESGEWGVLNLLGLGNPLASTPANRLVWGEVSGWTNSYVVVWGSTIQDPSGQVVVWGSSDYTDGTVVVWGSSIAMDR